MAASGERGAGLLDGRVVLVTGAGRGIGRAHALEIARHGATVVVNDLGVGLDGVGTDEQPAQEVVDDIVAGGGRAVAVGGSVSDWDAMGALVREIVGEWGQLDAVVNNAGILRDKTITSLAEDDWDKIIDVHLKGTAALVHHACVHWRTEHRAGKPVSGRIVNTTSGTGLAGNVGQAAYGAAKAGIANLTMTIALEGARYGVTANAISPVAATRMTAGILEASSEGFDRYDPANSSPVVAWLCSEASGWVTGRVFRVDGSAVIPMRPWELGPCYQAGGGGRLDATEIDGGMRVLFGLSPAGIAGLSSRQGGVA